MPELAAIKTDRYELVIWSRDICSSQQRLLQTMRARNKPLPYSEIHFNPAIHQVDSPDNKAVDSIDCCEAIFFENRQYDIEIMFDESIKNEFRDNEPRILHRLKSIEEAFHYIPRTNSLRASINTGNDLGWFRLELQYELRGKLYSQFIAFEVLPTKIDLSSDLDHMNTVIDRNYPLWRFSLAEKTQQEFAVIRKPHQQFLLLWLAQFEQLQDDLVKGLKHIVYAPHSRLVTVNKLLKAEQIKGRIKPKLEMEIRLAQNCELANKRFRINKKHLSIDTPENRFIKAVIKTSLDKLARIVRAAGHNQRAPENQRLSDSFFDQLNTRQNSLRHFARHAMFREIGDFSGLSKESLVLQQKPGYAKVYRVWQDLKLYLDMLGNDSSLSLRNVAELYEIWCFLEVRNILLELGFVETQSNRAKLIRNSLNVSMKDGLAGAFSFERPDKIRLQLAHEPVFKPDNSSIRTWTTTQRPDILLKAQFPDKSEFIWLFDAKYRIDSNDKQDFVPDDAINQMHRYRDALIHQHNSISDIPEKTRPVFGAYALYPGFYDQSIDENPYQQAIDEIGIGAFSLLPSDDQTGHHWLKLFLQQKLGAQKATYESAISEQYFVEEATRIPYRGTSVCLYPDLTIAVNGMVSDRSKEYRKNLEKGEAQYYHMKLLASERQDIEQHVIKEARYLAIAVSTTPSTQEICYLYPILGIEKKRREELTKEQTGTNRIRIPDEPYWLFKLGDALMLRNPVKKPFSRRFEVKLTSAASFSKVNSWDELPLRYQMLS